MAQLSIERLAPWSPLVLLLSAFAACSDRGADGGGGNPAASTASVSTGSASVGHQSSSSGPLPANFTVTGVVTDGQAPLPGAIVMQGGGSADLTSGADGTFTIVLSTSLPGTPTVVAAKVGYRSDGIEFDALPTAPITLVLREARPPDNALDYVYADPGTGDANHDDSTAFCGHCHTRFVADFQTSAHAKATRDPIVQDLYAGVASAISTSPACAAAGGVWKSGLVPGAPTLDMPKCYMGNGVLPDLNGCGAGTSPSCDDVSLPSAQKPTQFGLCADCHAGGMDGPTGGRNLHDAVGISYQDGNHCDFCHHIGSVDLASAKPGVAGKLVMQRPRETTHGKPGDPLLQVMFGPYPDVPNYFMGGSYQPSFTSATLCSGCHEYNQAALLPGASVDAAKWPDGLPSLSTYSEWSASSYNTPGTQCQFCHMPAIDGMFNSVDVSTAPDADITFGFGRTPEELRSHVFQGPLGGTPRLIDSALNGGVSATQNGSSLDVSVSMTNIGAGHAIPTGEAMRALILTVRVDGCGASFMPTSGLTVPDFGGAAVSGVVGDSVIFTGASVGWSAALSKVKVGDRVRVVRPSGVFQDYPGIGYFANPLLTPEDKGIEVDDPVGEAQVMAVAGANLTLSGTLPVADGDLVYLGDALPQALVDGDASLALAGAPGFAFARVMRDPDGARFVPHYRAVDIASDNRLPPQLPVETTHSFAIPNGCTAAQVDVTLLYRPLPIALGRSRAWDGRDYVVFTSVHDMTLQL